MAPAPPATKLGFNSGPFSALLRASRSRNRVIERGYEVSNLATFRPPLTFVVRLVQLAIYLFMAEGYEVILLEAP